MKVISNILSTILNRTHLTDRKSLLRLKSEKMRELIQTGDVDAIKQILKKEVLFKAYLLINKYIQSDIMLLDVNVYPQKELQFVYEENQQKYSIVVSNTDYRHGPLVSGLYKINHYLDNKQMTIGYTDRITINDDQDQEAFWTVLLEYVKESQKKIIDEKNALIDQEIALRKAREKEEKRLRLIEMKRQEAERAKELEQKYFS